MDAFPDEHLLAISKYAPWSAHIVNYLVIGAILHFWSTQQKDKFQEVKYYF